MGLLKPLKNSNSSSEERKLNEWLDDTSQNHSAIQSMLAKDSIDLSILKDYKQFDKSAAWSNITSHIDLNERPVIKFDFTNLYKLAAVGAVLIVSLFAFNSFFSNNNSSSQYAMIAATTEIMNEVNLPDGSIVHIDKQSAISFDEEKFMETRQVELTGRAFFEVAKMDGKNFVIAADGVNVEVLGTKFEVNAKFGDRSVTVEEGKVRVFNDVNEVLLTANEKAIINGNQITESINTSANNSSWKRGTLSFDDTNIASVISDLEQHFAIDIEVDNASSNLDCPITSTYTDQDLKSILKDLKDAMGANYKIEKNKVSISDLCK